MTLRRRRQDYWLSSKPVIVERYRQCGGDSVRAVGIRLKRHHVQEGVYGYLESNFRVSGDDLERLVMLASKFYETLKVYDRDFEGLKVSAEEFSEAVRMVESASVAEAEKELTALLEEHRQLTLSWAKASGLQQDAMKGEIDRLEDAIRKMKARTVRLSVRVEQAMKAEW